MQIQPVVLELIRLAYEAGADPARWAEFLSLYRDEVRSPTALIMVHHLGGDPRADIACVQGLDPQWAAPYENHYSGLNPWLRHNPMLVAGMAGCGEQVIEDSDLVKTEFYNDFLRPQDYLYTFGGTIRRDETVVSIITALRSSRAGGYGPGEVALLETLLPHLECALKIHTKLAGLDTRVLGATTALDAFPDAVLLLDAAGGLLFMNRAAESLLKARDGLEWIGGRLRVAERSAAERLSRLMASALRTARGEGMSPGRRILIPRPSGGRPYEVMIAPIPKPPGPGSPGEPSLAVFLSDPESQPGSDVDALQQLYRLTPAEARMAAALVRGLSIEESAEQFGVSIHTVRTQVKSILAKTETRRQSELVRLLMSSLARLNFQEK